MSDWADAKAREWYRSIWARAPQDAIDTDCPGLAALLRDVRAMGALDVRAKIASGKDDLDDAPWRKELLAEVRRVVKDVGASGLWGLRDEACREILRRLERL